MMYGIRCTELTHRGQVNTPEAIIIVDCLSTTALIANKICCEDHVRLLRKNLWYKLNPAFPVLSTEKFGFSQKFVHFYRFLAFPAEIIRLEDSFLLRESLQSGRLAAGGKNSIPENS
jgi:hypothetical protein